MEDLLSTAEAADALGISIRRVVELIGEGKLRAEKKGRDWLIRRSALAGVKTYGKSGRPPKNQPGRPATKKTPAELPQDPPGRKPKARRRRPGRANST